MPQVEEAGRQRHVRSRQPLAPRPVAKVGGGYPQDPGLDCEPDQAGQSRVAPSDTWWAT